CRGSRVVTRDAADERQVERRAARDLDVGAAARAEDELVVRRADPERASGRVRRLRRERRRLEVRGRVAAEGEVGGDVETTDGDARTLAAGVVVRVDKFERRVQ